MNQIGVSSLRFFNQTRLRELGDVVTIYNHSEPLGVIMPYQMYLQWQHLMNFDPANHHNALTCPYCNPKGLKLMEAPK